MEREPADTRADEDKRALQKAPAQRRLLLAGSIAFLALGFALYRPDGDETRTVILAVDAALAALLCMIRPINARFVRALLPLTIAFIFGGSIAALALSETASDVVRFGFMFLFLGMLICLLAPARRDTLLALAAMGVTGAAGILAVSTQSGAFNTELAIALLVVAVIIPMRVAGHLEEARHEGTALRAELARRATSDDITGVSNRAHVTLLAQNEFSRARRYGEPYSCLMIEIEDYDQLLAKHGRAALAAIIQVFTGYCVVVMRHCDSFGRLTPSRFLALLPETPAAGAHTLANRMCRDLAALEVAHGGGKLNFAVSIGATEMHAVDRWGGDMLRRAEQGLSDALERGGNRAVFASPPVHPQADEQPNAQPTAGSTIP